jgi:hypothetical protein
MKALINAVVFILFIMTTCKLQTKVVLRHIKIPVFLGLSEGCVYLILFYVAVVLWNIKIPFFLALSEVCMFLILFYVAVFPRQPSDKPTTTGILVFRRTTTT